MKILTLRNPLVDLEIFSQLFSVSCDYYFA